jgi:hypothetical protein
MIIEKTFKLTIKDAAYFLTEQEVTSLYEQCRQALNISVTNPNWPTYPPGVRKFDPIVPWPTDDNTTTGKPQWPTYPLPNTYCGNVTCCTTTSGTTDNSVMDWHDYHGVTGTGISTANVPSSKGINFISDDMATDTTDTTDNFGFDWNTGINKLNDKTNVNWRSSVQQALDKLSAKTNVTTSDGTTIR